MEVFSLKSDISLLHWLDINALLVINDDGIPGILTFFEKSEQDIDQEEGSRFEIIHTDPPASPDAFPCYLPTSSVSLFDLKSVLVGHMDGSVSLYEYSPDRSSILKREPGSLKHFSSKVFHASPITSISSNRVNHSVCLGYEDGTVLFFNDYKDIFNAERSPSLEFCSGGSAILSSAIMSPNILVTGSLGGIIRVHDTRKFTSGVCRPIASFSMPNPTYGDACAAGWLGQEELSSSAEYPLFSSSIDALNAVTSMYSHSVHSTQIFCGSACGMIALFDIKAITAPSVTMGKKYSLDSDTSYIDIGEFSRVSLIWHSLAHRGSVTSLTADGSLGHIISGGEDGRVCLFDHLKLDATKSEVMDSGKSAIIGLSVISGSAFGGIFTVAAVREDKTLSISNRELEKV
ncbi:hypothetical protein ADUPG1_009903 [Aduncisulcus paluster]|uniref:Uncharacterized protein n=1 Tax=Aduncisulcus paluster TaxID=2918883 RepID=A0ABQ5KX69_9EUKA|nr:hypothetical protein ADUPG1_009903 [Aduncisulcus paluster]